MYSLIRPLLFKLDPEAAHRLTLQLVRLAGNIPPSRWVLQALFSVPQKPVSAFGLTFPNPVGLAAGYDKDAEAVRGLSALGFGHLELGTITPRPQPGNPKPRIFRLVEDKAIINRMGFPGKGAEYALDALKLSTKNSKRSTLIGINLGKNKDTPVEEAANDYIYLMKVFADHADYLAINISSPNTVGLRRLQGREMLESLLKQVAVERIKLPKNLPILVKIAPDLSEEELDDAIGVILNNGMDGIIATNTTLAREGLKSRQQVEQGGLSGGPLTGKSDAVLARVVSKVQGRVPVIGVGGVMNADDAKRKLDLGATLVQVYSGMIYAGPGLAKDIVKHLHLSNNSNENK
jgi:dihydroorotate dehydrogenase